MTDSIIGPKTWMFQKHFSRTGYPNDFNFRYFTFQVALNWLHALFTHPLIVETGCQRAKVDIGDGASTSILGEYVYRNDGNLITVDISEQNIKMARAIAVPWNSCIKYVVSDSVAYLRKMSMESHPCVNMLYLDSYDYVSEDGKADIASQTHCLDEFLVAESMLGINSVLLVDDSNLPGGGKPGLLKEHLKTDNSWVMLLDYRQTLWVKTSAAGRESL